MKRKLFAAILAASLLYPGSLRATEGNQSNAITSTTRGNLQAGGQGQNGPPAQTRSRARRHSYEHETGRRHRSGISKKEFALMAAIAGTSMGIGAIAGGGKGLAIGSIVGGWGAYVGHRLWKWLK